MEWSEWNHLLLNVNKIRQLIAESTYKACVSLLGQDADVPEHPQQNRTNTEAECTEGVSRISFRS